MEDLKDFPFHTFEAYRKVEKDLENSESAIKTYEEFLGTITSEFRSQNHGFGNVKVDPKMLLESNSKPEDGFIDTHLDVNRDLGSKDIRIISNRCRRRIKELRDYRKMLLSDLEYLETGYNQIIEILGAYRTPEIDPISDSFSPQDINYTEIGSPVVRDFEWFNENFESDPTEIVL